MYQKANLILHCLTKRITLLQLLTGFNSSFWLEWLETITGFFGRSYVTSLLYLLLCDLERHNLVECIV